MTSYGAKRVRVTRGSRSMRLAGGAGQPLTVLGGPV